MRFLLFNFVVIGALFYLFTADNAELAAAADTAHNAVDRAERAVSRVVERAGAFVRDDGPDYVPPEIRDLRSEPVPEPAPVVSPVSESRKPTSEPAAGTPSKTASVAAAPPASPAPTLDVAAARPAPVRPSVADPIPLQPRVAESRNPPPPPPAPSEPDTAVEGAPERTRLAAAAAPIVVQDVPKLSVHKPSYDEVDAAGGQLPTSDPAIAKRRSEVLAGADTEAVPGKTPEIAIAEGAELMRPSQRRRELFALAEDMELFFLKNSGY